MFAELDGVVIEISYELKIPVILYGFELRTSYM